jgi:hypothetical protein
MLGSVGAFLYRRRVWRKGTAWLVTSTLWAVPAAADATTAAAEAPTALDALAMETTARVLRELKSGARLPARDTSTTLARAAEVLSDAGDIKGAAVAADTAWLLAGRPRAPRTSLLVLRYAAAIADDDPAGGLALAERALAQDPEHENARAWVEALRGTNTDVAGHATLGAGVLCGIGAATAFVWGTSTERTLVSAPHERDVVDALLTQRTAAAVLGYSALAASVATSAVGIALLWQSDEGATPLLPAPFLATLPEPSP